MRRVLGLILVALGVGFLVMAPLIKFVAVPKLAVAPLNLDTKDLSVAQGVVTTAADLSTGVEKSNVDLTARRTTGADVPASEQAGGNIGVYNSTNIVSLTSDKSGLPYLPASPERYAFDRTTAVMVATADSKVNGVPITSEMIGTDTIMPLKMPFFTEKKTYNVFDSSLMKGAPAVFVDEETIQGLPVYKFTQTIEAQKVGVQAGQDQWYQNVTQMYVEPLTGQVVDGGSTEKVWLKNADGTDGLVIVDGTLKFTPDQVSSNVDNAKANSSKLSLLSNVVPVVLLVLGVVLLTVGILLLRRTEDGGEPAPVSLAKH